MKAIAMGDIHGKAVWKQIVGQECDKIFFLGDYLDKKDEDISSEHQLKNLEEILEFKRQNKDKVILLIGNHDFHYFNFAKEVYSGFQKNFAAKYGTILHKALDEGLLQMCYAQDDLLFSHAGVTRTWCNAQFGKESFEIKKLEKFINSLFIEKPEAFKFTPGAYRNRFGNEECQTPIWVRRDALRLDGIKEVTHIVGHTPQQTITFDNNIVFIDTLAVGEYLSIENGKMKVESLKN